MKIACWAVALAACPAIAGGVTVGWREASDTNVAANASVTFDGRLGVGDGGVFYKLGAGTLTLASANAVSSTTRLRESR